MSAVPAWVQTASTAVQAGTGIVSPIAAGMTNRAQRNYNDQKYAEEKLDSFINWHRQNQYNEKQLDEERKYNLQMWEKQNQFNIEQWEKNNQYNSPIAQRQRLIEAGLNPALMYGNLGGSTANAISSGQVGSSAKNQAGDIGNPRHLGYNPTVPTITSPLMDILDLEARRTGLENARIYGEKLRSEALNSQAKTLGILSQSELTKNELRKANILFDTSIDAYKADALRKTNEAYLSGFEVETRPEKLRLQMQQLEKAIQQMPDRQKQIQADTALKQIMAEIQKSGTTNASTFLLRQLWDFVGEKVDSFKK